MAVFLILALCDFWGLFPSTRLPNILLMLSFNTLWYLFKCVYFFNLLGIQFTYSVKTPSRPKNGQKTKEEKNEQTQPQH